jgi:hypothetical protein
MSRLNNAAQPSANNDAFINWSITEEEAMLNFLIVNKVEAGDGFNFTWSKVAAHLKPLRTEGGVKTAKKCKEKWGQVHYKFFYCQLYLLIITQLKKSFNAITHLKILLGLPYTKDKGCNVNASTEDAWERYVKVRMKE